MLVHHKQVLSKETDTALVNRLNTESFELIKDDPDSAEALALQAIALSESGNYLRGLGDGYIRLGIIEKDAGNYDEAISFYHKSLQYRQQLGDRDLIARVFNNIGMAYSKKSEYDSAAFYLLKALKIAEELQLVPAQASYSMNLGIAYQNNGDYPLAFEYNHRAQQLYREAEDDKGLLKCLINEGGIYHSMKDYQRALPVFRRAVMLAEDLDEEREKYLAIGDLATTYMNLDRYDSAMHFMQQSLNYHRQTENDPAISVDLCNLGFLSRRQKKPQEAIAYFSESLALAEQTGDVGLAAKNTQELAELYYERGDFRKAFESQKKFATYNDSVFSISKAEAIAEMQTRFETEKKENQIILLNKDREIQTQQLARKTLVQFILIAGIAGLALIFVLIFNRYKLKRKIESQQELLNERRRISSELHDDLGAQLSTARMFLSKLKQTHPASENYDIIDSSLHLIDGSISDLRRIMDDLQASTLQERGIVPAVEELVNKINNLQQINFSLTHHGLDERLHPKTEHQLFRITQELINNTLKYAGAKNVAIDFLVRDEKVILFYEDDGKGFDPASTKRGYGLSNIRSRALSMGGEADLDSQPGKGSRTTIEMPLIYAAAKA